MGFLSFFFFCIFFSHMLHVMYCVYIYMYIYICAYTKYALPIAPYICRHSIHDIRVMYTEINNSPYHQSCVLHRNSYHHSHISQHKHAWYCFNLVNKACSFIFQFSFLLCHNYNDDSIIQFSLRGVERKNYTDISIHICTFLCIYICK